MQVGNGRLNYINGYVSKDHDSVDVGLGEYVQRGAISPWSAAYRLISENSPCLPEAALRTAQLPEFDGSVSTTTRRYREWRKGLEVLRTMNELKDTELAMLVYSQVTGRAKTLIELIEPEELKSSQALDTIYRL